MRLLWTFAAAVCVFACGVSAQTTQAVASNAEPPAANRLYLWDNPPGVIAGPDTDTDPTVPTMDVYLPDHPNGAAVIIFPGGAYVHLSTVKEGSDVAHLLNSHGIAGFVVRYRHSPRYKYPIPMLDARRAIRTVRSRADEFHVDPHRLGIMGFSAGGHLAATVATQFDSGDPDAPDAIDRASSRPDFAVLVYPVITLTQEKYVHKFSRLSLLGTHQELWPALSAELHVGPQTPPVFLVHATTDTTVPVENSILFYMACHAAGVPAEMHIFAIGRHGFGLAPADPALRVWPDLMLTWMGKNHWLDSH
jgi:acetyl esterase/lipase